MLRRVFLAASAPLTTSKTIQTRGLPSVADQVRPALRVAPAILRGDPATSSVWRSLDLAVPCARHRTFLPPLPRHNNPNSTISHGAPQPKWAIASSPAAVESGIILQPCCSRCCPVRYRFCAVQYRGSLLGGNLRGRIQMWRRFFCAPQVQFLRFRPGALRGGGPL